MCDQTKFIPEDISVCDKTTVSPSTVGPSCLRNSDRSKKGGITRNVSFPEDDSQIVTGILEPENPWKSVTDITNEDLISMYISSCKKHGTYPIPTVLDQLSKLELKIERNKVFSLKGVTLNATICETLEDILKHIQFQQINLESTALDDESSVALFDMLEYYESATHLNISTNHSIGVRGWQACARMIKKACCLEELEARNTTLNEVSMPILGRALKVGSQLQVLKLENCNLNGRPLIILASALKVNCNLKELYLGENNLGMNDANQLGSMLKCNTTLQLLDISHNDIKDVGFNYIIDGILDQGFGLTVLMVWNNQLTKNIAYSVVRLLEECTGLETLNIGQNSLSDDFLRIIKEPLVANKNLLRLGLQSTLLNNEAAFLMSDILKLNNLIQRVDLRDNNIQATGLASLLECLKENTSLIRLDLDKLPRKSAFTENNALKYKSLVEEIREKCSLNEKVILDRKAESENCSSEEEDSVRELSAKYKHLKLSVLDSRKISLTCESLEFRPLLENSTSNFLGEPKKNGRLRSPAPSPIPSPVSSPSPVRSRFQVSKVAENQNSPPFYNPCTGHKVSSRFKVTVVEPDAKSPCSDSSSSDENKEFIVPVNYISKRNVDEKECSSEEVNKAAKTKDEEIGKIKGEFGKKEIKTESSGSSKGTGKDTLNSMRSLSWVPPILQAPSAAMDSAKISANLEKLLGLFQNPFIRKNESTTSNDTAFSENTSDSARNSESCTNSSPPCDTSTVEVQQNEEDNCAENYTSQEFTKLSENIIRKLSEEIRTKEEILLTCDVSSSEETQCGEHEKENEVAWPQNIAPSYLSSPSKSSPSNLETTAFVLLQGQVSSDIASLQNIRVSQSENTTSEQT